MQRCRQINRKVTPAFIRSIRRAYLASDGNPTEGNEMTCEVLLKTLHSVQRGDYKWGMAYAKRNGINLEAMYRDYNRITLSGQRIDQVLTGFGRFCRKHNFGLQVEA